MPSQITKLDSMHQLDDC